MASTAARSIGLSADPKYESVWCFCQPKHYFEAGTGEALKELYSSNIIQRQDIFIQTKFTPVRGQDPQNIPYDPSKPLAEQVKISFATSLKNLNTDYLDS